MPELTSSRNHGAGAPLTLYKWLRLFAEPAPKSGGVDHEAEVRRLKRELARVTEERDILKKAAAYFAQDAR
jgi:transposase